MAKVTDLCACECVWDGSLSAVWFVSQRGVLGLVREID